MPAKGAWTSDSSPSAQVPVRTRALICPRNNVRLASRENTFDRLDDLLIFLDDLIRATKEELDCEANFVRHVVRLPAGDYSVRLPAKLNQDLLGESYQLAYRKFLSLERKLNRQPALKAQYAAFIKEYLALGHMS